VKGPDSNEPFTINSDLAALPKEKIRLVRITVKILGFVIKISVTVDRSAC